MRKNINHPSRTLRRVFAALLSLLMTLMPVASAVAGTQDPVTGAFEGTVTNSQTGAAIAGAVVQFINTVTEVPVAKRTDAQGRFYQGLLQPGVYRIRVSAPGFQTKTVEQRLLATRGNTVVPVPVVLDPVAPTAPPPTQPTQPQPTQPTPTTPTPPVTAPAQAPITSGNEVSATDGRRSGAYTDVEVAALPLGSTTFTRTFDSFALLIPGLALPPQTLGRVAGPGIGSGVGSAGQFSANGLRSRANNFLVDGSDNNDEDIGVRRQGFFMLVPQPVESIKEYQVISLLAPAQFGRNIGAQVNAISMSGGYETHGTFYGFLNTSDLNAREYFDTTSSGQASPLQAFVNGQPREVRLNGVPLSVRNPAAGKDSLTFGNVGFVLGGPLLPRPKTDAQGNVTGSSKSAFYFLSFEGATLNANKEQSFAVPTVEERGVAQTGATGLRFLDENNNPINGFPTTAQGDAVFSLYPFANNPNGIYGRRTYTQILPASAQGYIASFKMDHSFKAWARDQSITGRYNRTHDWRNIPATGGALYGTLRPVVGTQNFSFFWNGELTHEGATTPIFNQFRASYGRTRLNFEEERDRENLIESIILPRVPFTLNAATIENFTLPTSTFVDYRRRGFVTELGFPVNGGFGSTTGGALGPIGQVIIPGFSPLGVDVYNFPQRRVNNTFQVADILSFRKGLHNAAFGTDIRRSQLNSDLPRNQLPQLFFGGAPSINFTQARGAFLEGFFRPDTLAAASAASGFFQTITTLDTSEIGLRYSQYNFFAQDEWRVKPHFSLSFGLRYEYNTVPNEVNNQIENTFNSPALNLPEVAGLKQFIAGRTQIFDADKNNFGPRAGFAWDKSWGLNRQMVVRGGYGLFYDQIIGAVVSQSRNVFPNYLTSNTGGGAGTRAGSFGKFTLFNSALSLPGANFSNGICLQVPCPPGVFQPFVVTGTPNRFNSNIPFNTLVSVYSNAFLGGFGFTLPARELSTPMAHHYSLTVEQQLARNLYVSAAYVGTMGRNLLRLTTPNLGPNLNMLSSFNADLNQFLPFIRINSQTLYPEISGIFLVPGQRLASDATATGGRPVPTAGTVYLYQTDAESRYDSLQLQLRGSVRNHFDFQVGYVWSHALDDVSDVFDLAGAPALPQNSLNPSEYASANFDTRHRVTYNFLWRLPSLSNANGFVRTVFGGYEIAGTGQFQTGQLFTVNSINDINLDGNYTDRLNTTNGISNPRDGVNVLTIAPNAPDPRPPIGTNGAVGRNTFRGSNYLLLDLALIKNINLTERQRLLFRVDVFNFPDYANFAIPVRYLEAPSFGKAVDTITPGRRIQFALKYLF